MERLRLMNKINYPGFIPEYEEEKERKLIEREKLRERIRTKRS